MMCFLIRAILKGLTLRKYVLCVVLYLCTDWFCWFVKENFFFFFFFTYMRRFEICFCYWESLVVPMWPCAGWQHVLSKYQLTPTHVPWFYTVPNSCSLQFLWALGFPSCCHLSFLVHFLLVFRVLVSRFLRFLSPGFSSSYHLIFPAPIFRYLRFLFRSLFCRFPELPAVSLCSSHL